MNLAPSVMDFGVARVISPDGSHRIPRELQAEFDLLVLAEPEPCEAVEWIRNLEVRLGVLQHHRETLRGNRPWNILRVTSGMERKVCEALRDAGLSVYVPVEKYRPRNSVHARTRALIPGYIFALLPDDEALDLARKNYAVRDVMCDGGKPVRVRAIDIGALVLEEAFKGYDLTYNQPIPSKGKARGKRRRHKALEVGQMVKIAEGPFAGFPAEVMQADRPDRIKVLVAIFGRVSEVEMDEDMIEEPK